MKPKPMFQDTKRWTESAWVWLATVVVAGVVGATSSMLMETYGRHALGIAATALFPGNRRRHPFRLPIPRRSSPPQSPR